MFAELAQLKKNEINAKKYAQRVESTINDLEIEVQSLREQTLLMQGSIEENINKKEKLN